MISQLSMAKEGWKNGKRERNKITSVLSSRPHTVCSLLLSTRLHVCANTGAQLQFLCTFFFLLLAHKVFMFMLHWLPLSEARGHLEYVVQASNAGLPPSLHPPRPPRKKKMGTKDGWWGGGRKVLPISG